MPPTLNPAPRHFHFEHPPPPATSKLSPTKELPSLWFMNLVRLVPRRDTGTEALVKQRSWPALKVELGERSIIVDTAIEKGAVVWVDEEPFLLAFKRGLSLRRCCQHNHHQHQTQHQWPELAVQHRHDTTAFLQLDHCRQSLLAKHRNWVRMWALNAYYGTTTLEMICYKLIYVCQCDFLDAWGRTHPKSLLMIHNKLQDGSQAIHNAQTSLNTNQYLGI